MEFLLIITLILLNGVFSLAEIALFASRTSRLEELSRQGRGSAKAALKLLNNPEHFLSTVQTGITLIGIISGTIGGLALADELYIVLVNMGFSGKVYESLAIGLTISLITYLSIVLGELVPKTIGLANPKKSPVSLRAP